MAAVLTTAAEFGVHPLEIVREVRPALSSTA